MYNQEELLRSNRKRNFSLLVKGTNDCNFQCRYCFDEYTRKKLKGHRLSREQLVKLADMANEYAENITWGWHGGEATLLGIDYYKDFQQEFTKRYATEFNQTFQSNGYLIHTLDNRTYLKKREHHKVVLYPFNYTKSIV